MSECRNIYQKRQPKVTKTCVICGKSFEIHAFRLRQGGGKYCSKPCADKGLVGRKLTEEHKRKLKGREGPNKGQSLYHLRRPKSVRACRFCGKPMEISAFEAEHGTGRKYCSKICFGHSRKGLPISPGLLASRMGNTPWNKGMNDYEGERKYSGANHPGWKGGMRKDSNGYMEIYVAENGRKYMKEHIYRIEQYVGHKLDAKMVVHHINGNKADNRLDNLFLFVDTSTHIAYHMLVKNGWINPITKSNVDEYKQTGKVLPSQEIHKK